MKEKLSLVTRKVIADLDKLTDTEFLIKYSCTKKLYRKRLARYGDPYMKAPLARLGKFLGGKL